MVRLSIVALRTEKKHLEALWKLMRHEAERTWSLLTGKQSGMPDETARIAMGRFSIRPKSSYRHKLSSPDDVERANLRAVV